MKLTKAIIGMFAVSSLFFVGCSKDEDEAVVRTSDSKLVATWVNKEIEAEILTVKNDYTFSWKTKIDEFSGTWDETEDTWSQTTKIMGQALPAVTYDFEIKDDELTLTEQNSQDPEHAKTVYVKSK